MHNARLSGREQLPLECSALLSRTESIHAMVIQAAPSLVMVFKLVLSALARRFVAMELAQLST